MDSGEHKCSAFGVVPVDIAVSREIFRVLQPATLEASVLAKEQFSKQAEAVHSALQRDLQAAQYEATRAQKQFDATDPENRLVADELERRWNQALIEVQRIKQRILEVESAIPTNSDFTIDDFKDLAMSIELIWQNEGSSERLKKWIIRTLIREIVVDLNETAGEVNLVIHWQGGIHTELSVPRRKRGKATVTPSDTIEAVRVLTRVCTDQRIAGLLNRNGLLTGRGKRFTKERIASLRNHHVIALH